MKDEILIRYIQGDSTAEETEMVMKWIDGSKENEKHLMEMQHLFNASLEWDSVFQELEAEKPSSSKKVFQLQWRRIGAVAASLLIFFLGGWMLSRNQIQRNLSAQSLWVESIKVPVKQRLDLTLADGTEVCLNSGSTLHLSHDWNQKKRRVYLDGEAYFKVAPDKKRPFVVETGMYDIQVLGTTFNVNAYHKKGDFEVALLEGSVQINDKEERKILQLSPDEEVVLTDGQLVKHVISGKEKFSWTEGILAFHNELYSEIFKKLQAYYGIEIVIKNKKVNEYRATAKFYIDAGLDHILNVLKLFHGFEYSWNEKNDKIIIY